MTARPQNPWRPGTRFWTRHVVAPGLVAVALLFAFEHSGLDLWLAERWPTSA